MAVLKTNFANNIGSLLLVGLRVSVLLTAFLSVLGKVFHVIPFHDKEVRTIVINIGQFLIMAGGPVSIGGPPLVSATWFPPGERTTATAIATLAGYFGIAQSFAIGPAMVPNQFVPSNASNSSSSDCPERLTRLADYQLTKYMYFELGLCALVFFCVLLYFPARPPLPPSLTSSTSQRLSTKSSFRNLTRNRPFWLLATLTGLTFGIYFGWLSMLDVFLAKFGVDDITAGWLGCSATLAGVFSGIALAR